MPTATNPPSKAASRESKVEVSLTPAGLPQLFRDLAASLEGKPGGTLDGAEIRGAAKLKIEVKHKAGRTVVKVKAKHEEPAAPVQSRGAGKAPAKAAPGRPKYGSLKKRLKSSWKAVQEAVAAGSLPGETAAAAFLADSELMLVFPGKGDEYYAPYAAALAQFRRALGRGDLAGLKRACAELDRVKVQCHARYK